jgi:HAMP domain-containing protein
VRSHLSARSRLTLLYASLFTLGGAALVLITYLLVAHTLHPTATPAIPPAIQQALERCLEAAQKGAPGVMQKCAAVYANGVQAGAAAQRSTTLTHLLTYSLLTLAGVTLLAALAGWIVAGRILRPVRRLTAAARAASEQNLSQRIALQGPRDELRELADTFDTMLERLDRAFTSQRQFIANASHELRTPLTVMRTAMDVVLAKPEPTREELLSMAADVRQAVDHAERLIEALLVLARNDQARALTDPLDLAAVAEDALEGRTATGITTTATLGEALVTGDRVLRRCGVPDHVLSLLAATPSLRASWLLSVMAVVGVVAGEAAAVGYGWIPGGGPEAGHPGPAALAPFLLVAPLLVQGSRRRSCPCSIRPGGWRPRPRSPVSPCCWSARSARWRPRWSR